MDSTPVTRDLLTFSAAVKSIVHMLKARTTGNLIGFPTTLFLSTVLRALRELMYGGEIHHYQAYVLPLKTYCGLQRK